MYLLFAGEKYYPKGGWLDYKGSFETWKESKDFFIALHEKTKANYPYINWGHIVNSKTMRIAVRIYENQDKKIIVTQIDPEINLVS